MYYRHLDRVSTYIYPTTSSCFITRSSSFPYRVAIRILLLLLHNLIVFFLRLLLQNSSQDVIMAILPLLKHLADDMNKSIDLISTYCTEDLEPVRKGWCYYRVRVLRCHNTKYHFVSRRSVVSSVANTGHPEGCNERKFGC